MYVGELKSVIPEQANNRAQTFSENATSLNASERLSKSLSYSTSIEAELSDSGQIATVVMNRQMEKELGSVVSQNVSYTSMASLKVVERENQEFKRFDADEIANNVLGFVKQNVELTSEKTDSIDEVERKLKEAEKGIKRGFKMAIDELGSLVSGELKENIELTRDKIEDGIERLYGEYGIDTKLAKNDSLDTADKSLLTSFKIEKTDQTFMEVYISTKRESSRIAVEDLSVMTTGDDSLQLDQLVASALEVTNAFFYDEQIKGYADTFKQLDEDKALPLPTKVSKYMDKMLNLFDDSRKLLGEEDKYKSIINGLVNEMKDVQVPDLVSAINKFHSFTAALFNTDV